VKWLILRRFSQISILLLFIFAPFWIIKGNLSSSVLFNTVPLTDPYLLLQSFFAGHTIASTALIGAIVVLAFYFIVGGRVYCSWVCPINMITDAAAWLRNRLGIKGGNTLSRQLRYWILAMSLLVAFVTGTLAWELVNPVSMFQRGIIFGGLAIYLIILGIFLFDVFIAKNGWCGHLCPVGTFYGLVNKISILRIKATNRSQCDDCLDCFTVCPEHQVIKIPLKGKNSNPIISDANCTNCGRCIDVCNKQVFEFHHRFSSSLSQPEKTIHQQEDLHP
jgi:ferredoxin-type protein NapH